VLKGTTQLHKYKEPT